MYHVMSHDATSCPMKAHTLPEMTVKTAIWVVNSLPLGDADIYFFLAD